MLASMLRKGLGEKCWRAAWASAAASFSLLTGGAFPTRLGGECSGVIWDCDRAWLLLPAGGGWCCWWCA